MAEDAYFPLDQTRNTSTFQFLREVLRESDRPRRIKDQEEELNNPDRAREEQEQQPVNELGSLASLVELFQGVRQQVGEDLRNPTDLKSQEVKQNIAEAERRELQASRDVADPDWIEEPENRIQEVLGTNSLLGPRPSKLRDDSDASAVETERGQNISSLI
jgi:hypothetical protein